MIEVHTIIKEHSERVCLVQTEGRLHHVTEFNRNAFLCIYGIGYIGIHFKEFLTSSCFYTYKSMKSCIIISADYIVTSF
jgi:hypothetical protein